MLAASGLGNSRPRSAASERGCRARLPLPERIRRSKENLHEDQSCKRRSHSRSHRFADGDVDRRGRAIAEGKLLALDKHERCHRGEVRLGRGYGAFFVSESNVSTVAAYIVGQEQHHRIRTFAEELKEFVERHGLHWREEESR